MLKSKIRTKQQISQYMAELKAWICEQQDKPIEKMADFFADRIDIYEDVHLGRWEQEYKHIADYFDNNLGSLLDIGCGTGLELNSIYNRFPKAKVTGIDLSDKMLEKLKRNFSDRDIKLVCCDYFEYPFESEYYDAALSFETLHHFEYHKKQIIYNKLYSALKPKGYYIECDYIACCEQEELICLEFYKNKRNKFSIPNDVFVHIDIPLTLDHQIELMKNAGFKDVRVLYENCGTMIIRANK